jgi:hypothetical protein
MQLQDLVSAERNPQSQSRLHVFAPPNHTRASRHSQNRHTFRDLGWKPHRSADASSARFLFE